MDERDIARIVRLVKALCPAQKFDEYTPEAWELVLEDLAFADARQALKTLGGQLRFIAPSDIAQEVGRAARARASFPPGTGPEAIEAEIRAVDGPEDVAGYLRALRAERRRVAGPPVSVGEVVERTYVRIESKWNRGAIAGATAPLALEAAPDPAYERARTALGCLDDPGPWLAAAIAALDAEGIHDPSPQQIAIRGADLVTRRAA